MRPALTYNAKGSGNGRTARGNCGKGVTGSAMTAMFRLIDVSIDVYIDVRARYSIDVIRLQEPYGDARARSWVGDGVREESRVVSAPPSSGKTRMNDMPDLSALQKALAVQTEQLPPTLKAIEELRQSSAMARLTEEMNRHQDLMKRLRQPIDDLQRLTHSGVWAEFERVRAASELWRQQFRMPEMEELTRTLALYRESPSPRCSLSRL
jgi:hypothetical protein